uniref:G protein-coupled receptor kinase n=1 Tax=Plectus sambesii TaxID=2011161 RepID=A0A914UHF1_9BILA
MAEDSVERRPRRVGIELIFMGLARAYWQLQQRTGQRVWRGGGGGVRFDGRRLSLVVDEAAYFALSGPVAGRNLTFPAYSPRLAGVRASGQLVVFIAVVVVVAGGGLVVVVVVFDASCARPFIGVDWRFRIENIVANTVYIKARESGGQKKGKSKKWKNYLQFPHYTECLHIKDEIDCTYDFVIDKQPIGKRLFALFCAFNPQYKRCMEFLMGVEEYELNDDDGETRRNLAKSIASFFVQPNDPCSSSEHANGDWCSFLTPDEVEQCYHLANEAALQGEPRSDLFAEQYKQVRRFLAQKPFEEFVDSIYFRRYLQWKWLEKRPIDKHTFRLYRVLGKGGFGEVCACQVRASGKMYALKKLEKKRVKKRHAETLSLNEKQILQRINSPFV